MTDNITSANTTNESVFKTLRSLMPIRVLSYAEARQRAELQANRLLSLHGVAAPGVPIEIVTDLPRVRVEQNYDLPVSGSAHWDGGLWVISVNGAEYSLRQRFSVMHEFKHILDHPVRHLIIGEGKLTADDVAEKVADYFAACVLMPKAWVKSAFCTKTQSIEALADLFHVSKKAMSFRLNQLGLTAQVDRCSTSPPNRFVRSTRRYFRSLPTPTGVLT
jgi:Zn-dependent peptidase ImmA (M78 family)